MTSPMDPTQIAATAPPNGADQGSDRRRARLAEILGEMAESTRFPVRAIPHSLATTVLHIERLSARQARGVYWKTAAPAAQAHVSGGGGVLRATADEQGAVATFAQRVGDQRGQSNRIAGAARFSLPNRDIALRRVVFCRARMGTVAMPGVTETAPSLYAPR